MPPAVVVGRAAAALGHPGLSARQRVRAQQVIHCGFGAALGGAYLAAASRWPTVTRGRGALAGLALYAGTHGSGLPALGVQRLPWRLAPATVVWESTSHAVFGAALEAMPRVGRG
jgi:putative membrane protein